MTSEPRNESRRAAEAHREGHGRVRSEDDAVPTLPIVAVGVGALVIFFLASFVTLSYLHGQELERPTPPVPPEIGQSKIGLVEQQLFETAARGRKDQDARRKLLDSYGWVDRDAGVVRIPIGRAMDLTAEGVRPRAGGPGGPTPEGQP